MSFLEEAVYVNSIMNLKVIDLFYLFMYEASRTARIARDYGLEQAAVSGYGHAKKGIDVVNRYSFRFSVLYLLLLIIFWSVCYSLVKWEQVLNQVRI